MSTLVRRIASHRSIAAIVLAALYFIIASWLSAVALFGTNDGGIWIFMDWIYWPASTVVGWVRLLVKNIVPSGILHELPFASFSMLNAFDVSCCIIVGTFWYYFLVKTLSFVIANWSTLLKGFRRV
jgi:hypothetical protein